MENKNFSLNLKCIDKICIVEFTGYLSNGLTEALVPQVEQQLAQGCRSFLFNFSGVTMLESAAVAGILSTTEKIVDEFAGYLAFSNLNDMCSRVLEMVGVFLYAGRFGTSEDALTDMVD